MWYASDYSKHMHNNEDHIPYIGLTNSTYWDITVSKEVGISLVSYFQSSDYFIIGPTFTECANVVQVTIDHYILNCVGENFFNYLFGSLLTPFIITPLLYNELKP